MAEGLCRHFRGETIEPFSAGIETHGLNPFAVKVMGEIGIDISSHRSKTLQEFSGKAFDYVITVCGHANENCPVFPAQTKIHYQGFEDPPKLAKNACTEEETLAPYRQVRDEIKAYILKLPEVLETVSDSPKKNMKEEKTRTPLIPLIPLIPLEPLWKNWLEGKSELAPITQLLQIRPVSYHQGFAHLKMEVSEAHHNASGTVHGGIYVDFADVAMGVALASVMDKGQSFSTIELHIHYFRPNQKAELEAKAQVLRQGKRTAYLECEIIDKSGNLVAKVDSTFMIFSQAGKSSS
jgi:arsenate reductase